MAKVFINKDELLKILRKNLVIHNSIYKVTLDAFKKNYIKTLKKMCDRAKSGHFELYVNMQAPASHKNDYVNAIRMVELSSRDEIELSDKEISQYVYNKWDWIQAFRSVYYSNVASCSPSNGPSISSSSVNEYFSSCGEEDNE